MKISKKMNYKKAGPVPHSGDITLRIECMDPLGGNVVLDGINIPHDTMAPYNLTSTACNSDGYSYGFNGQFKDNEWAGLGNHLDFGARMYDTRIGRFRGVDRYSGKFPEQSPYTFAANSPIGAVDVNGDYVYILAYTVNNNHGDDMFKASALTRKYDIEHSSTFNSKRDKVAMIEVTDLAKLNSKIKGLIAENQERYGFTIEFGLWSHSGLQGPVGSEPTSENAAPGTLYQMDVSGYNIDMNWSGESSNRAGFYGCRSGVLGPDGKSFTTEVSGLSYFNGVNVVGQPGSAFPSQYTDERNETISQATGDYLPIERRYVNNGDPAAYVIKKTYLISGNEGEGKKALLIGAKAYPMTSSKDGAQKESDFQPGSKK